MNKHTVVIKCERPVDREVLDLFIHQGSLNCTKEQYDSLVEAFGKEEVADLNYHFIYEELWFARLHRLKLEIRKFVKERISSLSSLCCKNMTNK